MWCIFTPLYCGVYSKDYEDDDSNRMIFLFLWCQSWCIHWWTRVILITEEKDLSKRKPSLHRVDEVERATHLGTSFFMIMIIIIFLKNSSPASKLQLTARHCLNFLKHSSFNFEPHPRMLFQRLTDAKNSREPEHVMVQGDQNLTIFNFNFKHMMRIMNQHLKTPRHVMV